MHVLGLDFTSQEFNYLTFEEALIGAKDDTLHPAVRSKYVELIVGMGWVQMCMCEFHIGHCSALC